MNLRERLSNAYKNICFDADSTWSNSPNVYHKSNLELCLRDRQIGLSWLYACRPRTVRESIPRSRLAQYSNYTYNEAREMSYASSLANSQRDLFVKRPTESWQMPEVSELYKWFLKPQPEGSCCRLEGPYESPLLSVTAFEDKIMKLHITEDRIKNVWNDDDEENENCRDISNEVVVNLFKSPLGNIYLMNNVRKNHEWFRSLSVSKDIEEIENLSKSFKDQMASVSTVSPVIPPPSTEPSSNEILYSEVLQGLSPSRKVLFSKLESKSEDPSSSSNDNFTNFTVLTSQKSQEDTKFDNSSSSSQPSSSTVSQKGSSIFYSSDSQFRYKYPQFQVDPVQSRTSIPFTYPQQTYFYSPVQTMQRWIPPNYNSYYPTQILTSSWYPQTPAVASVTSSRVVNPSSVENRDSEIELDCYREEHPISASISEELEIQALEQYSNSNENFYQELERQATEQYSNQNE